MRTSTTGLTLSAALALGMAAHADEWDVGGDADNAFTTDNLVFHGAEQVHDLAVYGGLSGKAVSVEPSTGFTFDTAMVPRPR